MNHVYMGEALCVMATLPDESVDMVYIDPPFGTGTVRKGRRSCDPRAAGVLSYGDQFDDYVGFLKPHLEETRRLLKPTGTLYLHLDYRWVHYAKVECDNVYGRECFLNEVIWAYDFGGRGRSKWPAKHDNILVYARNNGQHVFNWDEIDRLPYAAPGLQLVGHTPEEAAKRIEMGKVPTDVWFMSIVGTSSKERTGYPTQKPVKLVERAIRASCPPSGTVLDVFAGSGTTGQAALNLGREFILADVNPQAIEVMRRRFKDVPINWVL